MTNKCFNSMLTSHDNVTQYVMSAACHTVSSQNVFFNCFYTHHIQIMFFFKK